MIDDAKIGEDEGSPSWYPSPFMNVNVIENGESKVYTGTYKHTYCSGKTTNDITCLNCQNIPHIKSFKKSLMRHSKTIDSVGNRDTNKIRYEYLTHKEQINVLREKSETAEDMRIELFFLKS